MLQTHFLRRYPTKPNTTLESKAAFVHLNCIVHLLRFVDEHAIRVNESIAFLTLTADGDGPGSAELTVSLRAAGHRGTDRNRAKLRQEGIAPSEIIAQIPERKAQRNERSPRGSCLDAFISHMGARHTNDKIGRFNLNEVAFFNTDILAHENHQTEIVPERFVEKFILPPQVEALQIPIALVDMR
ncbi:hypothetical protein GEV33_011056 [Tenebrio molitor]|uniref:Uncharacterized protein n=1 Tax=Tenebrio molitor TaxID=7067 RepID=A0A8J6H4L8_TENMO|nr:hypothetical protein GEV33_011056 [Tenebrio molitor]